MYFFFLERENTTITIPITANINGITSTYVLCFIKNIINGDNIKH